MEQIPEACGPHPSLRVAASTFRFVTVIYVISAAVKVNCPAPWYFINDLQITAEREKKKKKYTHAPVCVQAVARVISQHRSRAQVDSCEKCGVSTA